MCYWVSLCLPTGCVAIMVVGRYHIWDSSVLCCRPVVHARSGSWRTDVDEICRKRCFADCFGTSCITGPSRLSIVLWSLSLSCPSQVRDARTRVQMHASCKWCAICNSIFTVGNYELRAQRLSKLTLLCDWYYQRIVYSLVSYDFAGDIMLGCNSCRVSRRQDCYWHCCWLNKISLTDWSLAEIGNYKYCIFDLCQVLQGSKNPAEFW